ncbi:MAG TPA: aminotransferase class III-fold pyridoxal phosphate-dependent enzyme [Myxococcales bacterium]|nr:aminotransferase class III-fold pyridoxal phosphate-dependent enzyme [Myxococcales bacterium]
MNDMVWLFGAAAVAGLPALAARLRLSKAKHPSLRGHARIARWVASLVPFYEYGDGEFFRADGAPTGIEALRRSGFARLAATTRNRFARSAAATSQAAAGISDLQFTSAYRVPFQFSRRVRESLAAGAFVQSSSGVTMTDLDGNVLYDLTGAYGVNVFGSDFYKECMSRGSERVKDLGLALGPYHPVVADNVRRIRELSGMDEVSFHMSGTEAVMQAVRLARYHTGRTHLVRFTGAYHGWWGDVQPGVGNPQAARETYTLKEMSDDTLRVLLSRRDIACVLVNPLQAMHPNASAPTDSMLLDSGRRAGFDKAPYVGWLRKLRDVCSERGIALVFDEVFIGFRIARGGAQEYFGVQADLVTWGKTIGGGFPVGVLAGKREWMRRFRPDRPADVCFARGTFNSHPYVMGAMQEFLQRLDTPAVQSIYGSVEAIWNERAQRLNQKLAEAKLPLEVRNFMSIWTVCYTRPGRYNWMLQYYLRAAGLLLSWVGTGRLIFSLDWPEADFEAVCTRFVEAAQQMEADGFFWHDPALTNRSIQLHVLREMIAHRFRFARASGPSALPARAPAARPDTEGSR